MAVIEIEGLHKEYRRLRGGRTIAVAGLDLSVPEGGVFGFLGPNGAGKTTTIRCLLGLVSASDGRMQLMGADVPRRLPSVIGRVGSIVETPTMFPRFTARRNLEILATIQGVGRTAVKEVLETVGLAERADDRVRTYSLGMKQRLGIAAALLKDPALLILDEPANGLDPAGIVEVRELVRRLGGEGRTVFVSSHILSEIQHTADRVAIIARGHLVKEGPVREVLARGGAEGLIVPGRGPRGRRPGARRRRHRQRPRRRRAARARAGERCVGRDARARRARHLPQRAASRRARPGDRVPGAHEGRGAGTVIRLLRAELRRFVSRDVVRMFAVAVLIASRSAARSRP